MEIKGYPNYRIYPDGKVWSNKRKIFLKHGKDRDGYMIFILMNNGKRKTCKSHRLVAEHYISNPEGKTQVDHINRIKTDNRIENLRWVTYSENNINRIYTGKFNHRHIWIHTLDNGEKRYEVKSIKRDI